MTTARPDLWISRACQTEFSKLFRRPNDGTRSGPFVSGLRTVQPPRQRRRHELGCLAIAKLHHGPIKNNAGSAGLWQWRNPRDPRRRRASALHEMRPRDTTLSLTSATRSRELYQMPLMVEEAPKCEAVAFVALGCREARADQRLKNGAYNIAELE
jgi:hypothetical protein